MVYGTQTWSYYACSFLVPNNAKASAAMVLTRKLNIFFIISLAIIYFKSIFLADIRFSKIIHNIFKDQPNK